MKLQNIFQCIVFAALITNSSISKAETTAAPNKPQTATVQPTAAATTTSTTPQTPPTAPLGKWKTIDDETHKPKSIVEITKDESGKLIGHIIDIFPEPNEPPNPICDKCEGESHNKPVRGFKLLWDFEKKSDEVWESGHITDPKNGKTYKCTITVIEGGKKLKVRGYIGFSLLGRSQIWEREI